jgi:RNA polymerase sigma factor (sigma-70 family)
VHIPTAHLVEGAVRGDRSCWERLVKRYVSLLWAVVRANQLSGNDAADVVQTSWLRLIEHLPRLNDPDRIGAWLATTARRESVLTRRRLGRCQPSDEIEVLVDGVGPEVDAQLLCDERDAALWSAFRRLKPHDQALLRLLTADPGPSYVEFAAALGMPVGSIGPKRARALARLRRQLVGTRALAA